MAAPISAHSARAVISFKYESEIPRIELFEVNPLLSNFVNRTGIYPHGSPPSPAPAGKKWAKNSFELSPGKYRSFVLLMKNDSDKDRYFFAVPHLVKPGSAALGHHFECLCNHSVFKVPRGHSWYRIVRLQLSKHFSAASIELTHSIVEVSEAEVQTTYAGKVFNYD